MKWRSRNAVGESKGNKAGHGAVSYTHLDVYKRPGGRQVIAGLDLHLAGNAHLAVVGLVHFKGGFVVIHGAVSYTHLDVYKRQVLSRLKNLVKACPVSIISRYPP